MLVELKLLQHGERVGVADFLCRATRIQRYQNGDEAAHDQRIAVADKLDVPHTVLLEHGCIEPDLADAAGHLVFIGMLLDRQWFQILAQFDDVTVTVLPIVQEVEVLDNRIDRHAALPGFR